MKHLNIKFLWTLNIIFISMLILSGQVYAGNSWLNKGSDLLKSFGEGGKTSSLTTNEIGAGLKEALRVGSGNVVKQLGTLDGFNNDSNIHIPLPETLEKVKSFLSKVGKASLFEDLELKLNRAAEAATPKAKKLFSDAITSLTMEDVKGIYEGPNDAATQYFKGKMSPELSKEMKPVIDEALSEVGAIKSYDNMIKQYKSIPFVPDVKADLTEHVVEKGMDGIFYYMAKEEAAIRQNPVKRTTELLKKVFTK
ncbi:MAG: DUF4197 domain-containing protein [Desulfobacula sp.]|jgi:hypothetical protein|uniref:DUF4197 domain-containing protein n=1 Tax=Desulfobacula sp. TaxID=2593537 RepID=UPI001D4173C5|nr:DUF4197 domain-containing protein [Desulfobacula sp.]MBT3484201.1 DUF4197 domain-containing protein [Desulfobacula sp.]MBT3804325.1 DUF4197 domain-containing protein [Desulfobacula sp.]MBT4026237.1 DUF4197 domain-containing protein [Desulfobacula sp.]MBT4197689.1 DUF4197 domain-containing protein [Desulfobacula sp.]